MCQADVRRHSNGTPLILIPTVMSLQIKIETNPGNSNAMPLLGCDNR